MRSQSFYTLALAFSFLTWSASGRSQPAPPAPSGAPAQPGPSAPTEGESRQAAQILFDEGKSLMQKGDYETACSRFEEASRLYPDGIGVRESLADCYLQSRKLASAEATYDKAVSMAAKKDPERAAKNQAKKDQISPRVSRLTITIAPELASLPGLSVTRNGQPVPLGLLNRQVPVDGGKSTIRATASDHAPFEQTVDIPFENGNPTITIVLDKAAKASPTKPAKAPPTQSDSGLSGLAIAGFALGGVGVAALATGIGVAMNGVAKTNAAVDAYIDAHDRGDEIAFAQAADDHAAGRTQAIAGWVVTGIGGAALGMGIILVSMGYSGKRPSDALVVSPWWGNESAGLSAAGRF